MKKLLKVLIPVILLMGGLFGAAGADRVYQCDPAVTGDGKTTKVCWYYDSSGQKAIHPSKGYAGFMEVYENIPGSGKESCLTLSVYLDPQGDPMTGSGGYAKNTIEYVIREEGERSCSFYTAGADVQNICGTINRFFDEKDEPVLAFGQYAVVSETGRWQGDEFIQTTAYFGTDGEPVFREDIGYSSLVWILTAERTESRFYGSDGKLVISPLGYAVSVETYNDDEHEAVLRYYDTEEKPMINPRNGAAAVRYIWAGHRRYSRIEFLDAEGRLMNNLKGYSVVINEFKDGVLQPYPKPTKTEYLDKDGRPVEITEDLSQAISF